MKNVVSLSGGKDSTAMLLMMIDRGEPIHSVVYCDMGPWEFPEMHEHINKLEAQTGIPIVRLKPRYDPVYQLITKPVVRRGTQQVYRFGNNWPSYLRRWCTREKVNALHRYSKSVPGAVSCIGIAADETKRVKKHRYPLMEYGVTGEQALQYSYNKGYTWDGLYGIFNRVSCFCCPLQKIGELRKLRQHFPDLWGKMLYWDSQVDPTWGFGFRGYETVHDLEERFRNEK